MGQAEVRGEGGGVGGTDSPFRVLPSVELLLRDAEVRDASPFGDAALATVLQDVLARLRDDIAAGATPTAHEVRTAVLGALRSLEQGRLVPVINGTGIVVHTNLGRSPVSEETAAAMAAAAAHYVPLEIEPETNERGGRMREISDLMRLLTGAEATLVVNNNAAAVLLVLSAVAVGRGVVVSRGEAVEIGGGFRVPDVLRQSGARLVEVGTTNRTYARDYAEASDDDIAAYLKVHPSNFRVTGFTHAASTVELVDLGRPQGIPVIEDLGSGALLDTSRYGLEREPTVGDSLEAGAGLVMASGDKLLGGPQAGIIAGQRRWVERVARHPLARAVRADKTCLAGVAATLRHYARGEAERQIPVWRMIGASSEEIRNRADAVASGLGVAGIEVSVEACLSAVGGGALPGQTLASWAIVLPPAEGGGADDVARRLRLGRPGVFARIDRDRVVLDLRTVMPEDEGALVGAVVAAVGSAVSGRDPT